MADHGHSSDEREGGLLSNAIAIIGFIVVLVIVIWGLFHLINLSREWFGSLFSSTPSSAVTISAPSTVESGTLFEMKFASKRTERGTYAMVYKCTPGLSLKQAISATGRILIPCGASYTMSATPANVTLEPTVTNATGTPLTMSVIFSPAATTSTQAEGTATLTVVPRRVVTPTPAPVKIVDTTPSTPTEIVTETKPVVDTTPRTPADLSIRVNQVGVVDTATGRTIAGNPASRSEVMVVEFTIQNIGGTASGAYYFEADLPTGEPYHYVSPRQASLTPGSSVVNTLRYTVPAQSGGTISITVDPSYSVKDSNTSNNKATRYVSGFTEYQQSYPQYYPNQYYSQPYDPNQYQYNYPQYQNTYPQQQYQPDQYQSSYYVPQY